MENRIEFPGKSYAMLRTEGGANITKFLFFPGKTIPVLILVLQHRTKSLFRQFLFHF